MARLKRVELGQETLQSENEVLPFSVNYEIPWMPSKNCNQTNGHQIILLKSELSRLCKLLSAARRMNTFYEVLLGKRPMFYVELFS